MATLAPDAGLETAAKHFKASVTGSVRVRLFSNNLTPDADTDWGDLTEATFSGYAAQNPGSGTFSLDTIAHEAILTFATVTFTADGSSPPQTIYGWALLDDDLVGGANAIILAGRFSPALNFASAGDSVNVTPVMKFKRP